ncbi:hypothetical protein [Mycobacterium avium]|uniref:hypothetical protein n=1 Tax=Mycobacterium avium TaxID=1764 RepID=UPI001CC6F876|nr:hypothetical protein [Mycobacterium avium]MBZ4518297.1 hypothetical protein [Mycobacterium avium subsp. hominissuis]MBZ4547355.1 hypothetical protein [Mycobacterium avium subsp. hominissuis]MBZ4557080.1 hypothetical protein [Mycobacterium avium subsp. hominissuis]MBZ4566731.1 hypothetical protein [Mycobacterium avium subsp. hominissuis]MBZ4632938.1 hypothetical protein [Mycobacterium avium subsp. hominissuis]
MMVGSKYAAAETSTPMRFSSPDNNEWAQLVADNLAAALRRRGFDAHPHGRGAGAIGVEIRAVHVAGWRYPDGRWEFQDQPVQIVADLDSTTQLGWWLVDGRRELAVPVFGSVEGIAEWIARELPARDHLTCRLERHPDLIDANSPAIPPDWFESWQLREVHHDGF